MLRGFLWVAQETFSGEKKKRNVTQDHRREIFFFSVIFTIDIIACIKIIIVIVY